MKNFRKLTLAALVALSVESFAQLKVDNTGNVFIKSGNFYASGMNATLNLGNTDHYIKSDFGYGVSIGTSGSWGASLRLTQYSKKVGVFRDPSYTLDVDGDIRANSTVYSSDARLKTNVNELSEKVKLLSKLKGVSYNYLKEQPDGTKGADKTTHFGFIAQDLQKVYPELVSADKDGILAVDYISLIPLLVDRLNDQTKEIEQLKAAIITSGIDKNSSSNKSKANVNQNNPNPFSENTEIKCFIPKEASSAYIYIYDLQGSQKRAIAIADKGDVITTIKAGDLTAGLYLYSLVVDNQIVDTKKMILTEQ